MYSLANYYFIINFKALTIGWNLFDVIQADTYKDIIYVKKEQIDSSFYFTAGGYKRCLVYFSTMDDTLSVEQTLYRFLRQRLVNQRCPALSQFLCPVQRQGVDFHRPFRDWKDDAGRVVERLLGGFDCQR